MPGKKVWGEQGSKWRGSVCGCDIASRAAAELPHRESERLRQGCVPALASSACCDAQEAERRSQPAFVKKPALQGLRLPQLPGAGTPWPPRQACKWRCSPQATAWLPTCRTARVRLAGWQCYPLMASHFSLTCARSAASRLVLARGGRALSCGRPAEIACRPPTSVPRRATLPSPARLPTSPAQARCPT